jgi:hypothetical protein
MQIDWLRWAGGALVLLGAAGWFFLTEWDDVKTQTKGYSFSKTLPKAIDAVGGDARVVSVIDRGRDVQFVVLTGDGRVLERFYGKVCTKNVKGSACAYREKHDEHRASAGERKRAQVRLDQLDSGVVKRLRKETGIPDQVPLGLRGRYWVVGSYQPSVAAIADLDGSHLHHAESAAERALARSVASDPGR